MEIKLIACDLDGTLLDSRGRLSPENLDAIRRMTDEGYCFVPTSGRNREPIPQALPQFPGIRYLLTLSGACVTPLPRSLMNSSGSFFSSSITRCTSTSSVRTR